MIRPLGPLVLVVALGLGGCAKKGLLRLPPGKPVDAAPLAERLRAYNAGPRSVRAQGRLIVRGKGSAEFGARAAEGVGFRMDAVAGPFSTPVVALACRTAGGCRAYVPSQRRLYLDENGAWEGWLGALLRGRVPEVGTPTAAWVLAEGHPVLELSQESGWTQEVEFDPETLVPTRVVLSQDGQPEVEVRYDDYFPVGGHPFPGQVVVRVREPQAGYVLEFRRVEPDAQLTDGVLSLAVPPDTVVVTLRGIATWNETGIPFWFPRPDG